MKILDKIFDLKALTPEQIENIQRNEASIIEVYFEMFKQFAWLGSATIGGIVLLVQLNVLEMNAALSKEVAAFAISILLSIFGQISLVAALASGKTVAELRTAMTLYTIFILFVFGLGIGMALPK